VTWQRKKSGWGVTYDEARGTKGWYTVKATGGRHITHEVLLNGKRVGTCGSLRRGREVAESHEART
jgi:hypothetical protein